MRMGSGGVFNLLKRISFLKHFSTFLCKEENVLLDTSHTKPANEGPLGPSGASALPMGSTSFLLQETLGGGSTAQREGPPRGD